MDVDLVVWITARLGCWRNEVAQLRQLGFEEGAAAVESCCRELQGDMDAWRHERTQVPTTQ
jgi:hypothetical protein